MSTDLLPASEGRRSVQLPRLESRAPMWHRPSLVGGVAIVLVAALASARGAESLPVPLASSIGEERSSGIGSFVALSAGLALPAPDAASNGFEITSSLTDPSVTPQTWIWGPWVATQGAGVTSGSGTLPGTTLVAPEGTRTGYVTGTGSLSTTMSFDAGLYRLRYLGAQSDPGNHDVQVVRVEVGGAIVAEHEFGAVFDDHMTRVFEVESTGPLDIAFSGLDATGTETAFIDVVEVEPVADWRLGSTWDVGTVPDSSSDVTIPEDVVVALSGACAARTVEVCGELLALEEDTSLDANWLYVAGTKARFAVGSEDVPFEHDFTLTLVGDGSVVHPELAAELGSKFLVADRGGRIRLFGRERVSWTKLTDTVSLTDPNPVLELEVEGDWDAGDRLVIAGTSHQYLATQDPVWVDFAEEVEVATAQMAGGVVLTAQLQHPHYGDSYLAYTAPGASPTTWVVDQRAEVGLLSHNVVVQGDAASEATGYGGHVMIRNVVGDGHPSGCGRFSNVEFFRMGQKGLMGRYPLHWHLNLGEGEGQYAIGCSIHHSYNRAVTIHGTEYVHVKDCVAYDNVGHAIFLEDGSERFNHICRNLVLTTRLPDSLEEALLQSDFEFRTFQNRSPASFWITNPNNVIDDNVAAGTVGTGFWFAFPDAPAEPSSNIAHFHGLVPSQEPLGSFARNVCHSSRNAIDFNDGIAAAGKMDLIKNLAWVPSEPAIIEDFVAYACHTAIYSGDGPGDIRFERAILADNTYGITLAGYQTVQNSLVVADTGNCQVSGNQAAYRIYDGAGRVFDTHFVGFTRHPEYPGGPFVGGYLLDTVGGAIRRVNHLFSGVSFETNGLAMDPTIRLPNFANAFKVCDVASDPYDPRNWMIAIRDVDGSLTGVPNSSIVGDHRLMNRTVATGALQYLSFDEDEAWTVPGSRATWISPYRFGSLRVRLLNGSGNPVATSPVRVTREAHPYWESTSYEHCSQVDQHKQIAVVLEEPGLPQSLGYVYTWDWCVESSADPTFNANHSALLIALGDLEAGNAATLRLCWNGLNADVVDDVGDIVAVEGGRVPFEPFQYANAASLQSGSTTGYYFDDGEDKVLWLRLVAPTGVEQVFIQLADLDGV